jgi:hypothetical protein
MTLPGFSAETSLGKNATTFRYHTTASRNVTQSFNGRVVPSLQVASGCGACTETKWPNGTGTGACVQDCCDVLGNCQIKACPCSGSGFGFGFGSGARFGVGSFLARR